ncbi:unnamed protein product [Cochlearia groenlandica]
MKEEVVRLRETTNRQLHEKELEVKQRDSDIEAKKLENASLKDQVNDLTKQLQTIKMGKDELQREFDGVKRKFLLNCPSLSIVYETFFLSFFG